MTFKLSLCAGLWALCAAAAGPALAARPFNTEDAGVLSAGECEWDNAVVRNQGSDSSAQQSTQLGCGWGERHQFNMALGRARISGLQHHVGALSGKTRLWGDEDSTRFSVAWTAYWDPEKTTGGKPHATTALLVLTHPVAESWQVHAHVGRLRDNDDRQNRTLWSVAAEHQFSERWHAGLELYNEGQGQPWWGLGTQWRLNERWTVNALAAQRTGASSQRLFTAGFKLEF